MLKSKRIKGYNIKLFSVFTLITLMIILLWGCSHNIQNNTLKEIQKDLNDPSLTETKASEYYDILSAIKTDSLNEGERNLHSFLLIKAADKAYITHTNDTAYLKIKDYFKDHNKDLYPEVLYYGGRVYSDIGDYPTALQYFHEALEVLPENKENLRLRAIILSQRGQLFSNVKLRMYHQALQAFMEAINIEKNMKDSLGLIYDYTALGATYMHLNDYNNALKYYKKSQYIAKKISPENIYHNNAYIAYIYSEQGNHKEALNLIRSAITKDDSINWIAAKAYAVDIYLKANIRDTAYLLARELANRKDSYNREYGYEMMLSPELIPYVNRDSLLYYISDYKNLLDKYYDRNQNQAAIIQTVSYNYQIHDRKRKEAEENSIKLQRIIGGVLIILLIAIILAFYFKNRNQKNLIRLHKALENVEELKKIISSNEKNKNITLDQEIESNDKQVLDNKKENGTLEDTDSSKNNDEQIILKKRIRNELIGLSANSLKPHTLPYSIIESEVYHKIQDKLKNGKVLTQCSELWTALEERILLASPYFKQHILLLTGGRIKEQDYQMLLLIKCGFNPTQISNLIGRGKSTISYRREKLCLAIFGEKLETKTLDYIISSL